MKKILVIVFLLGFATHTTFAYSLFDVIDSVTRQNSYHMNQSIYIKTDIIDKLEAFVGLDSKININEKKGDQSIHITSDGIGVDITIWIRTIKNDTFVKFDAKKIPEFLSSNPILVGALKSNAWILVNENEIKKISDELQSGNGSELQKDITSQISMGVVASSKILESLVKLNEIFTFKKTASKNSDELIYAITFNPKKFIAYVKTMKTDSTMTKTEERNLQKYVSMFSLKKSYITIDRITKNPKKLVLYMGFKDPKNKIYNTTIGFNSTFTDFGNTFSEITAPENKMGAYDFYKKYFEVLLKDAKTKALLSGTESRFSNLRPQGELAIESSGMYGTAASMDGQCSNNPAGSVFAKSGFKTELLRVSELVKMENMKCYSTLDAWAVSAKVPESNQYYCTDSAGYMGTVISQISKNVCDNKPTN